MTNMMTLISTLSIFHSYQVAYHLALLMVLTSCSSLLSDGWTAVKYIYECNQSGRRVVFYPEPVAMSTNFCWCSVFSSVSALLKDCRGIPTFKYYFINQQNGHFQVCRVCVKQVNLRSKNYWARFQRTTQCSSEI